LNASRGGHEQAAQGLKTRGEEGGELCLSLENQGRKHAGERKNYSLSGNALRREGKSALRSLKQLEKRGQRNALRPHILNEQKNAKLTGGMK